MKRFLYFFREAFASLRAHQASTFIGILTTAFTLMSFGVFFLLYHNVHNIVGRIQHNIQIIVYPKNGLEPEKLQELNQSIKANQAIESITFISEKDALNEFKNQFPEEVYLLKGIDKNPFPASLVLAIASPAPSTDVITNLVNQLQHHPGIERVQYNRDWVERLTLITTYFEWGAVIIGSILAFSSVTIIANTIQLAFYTRQEEIGILRLIGATNTFISIPYFIEGGILGAVGGGVAVGFLRGGFEIFKHKTQELSIIGGTSSVFEFFPPVFSFLLIAGGILLGCIGTFLTIWTWMRRQA